MIYITDSNNIINECSFEKTNQGIYILTIDTKDKYHDFNSISGMDEHGKFQGFIFWTNEKEPKGAEVKFYIAEYLFELGIQPAKFQYSAYYTNWSTMLEETETIYESVTRLPEDISEEAFLPSIKRRYKNEKI